MNNRHERAEQAARVIRKRVAKLGLPTKQPVTPELAKVLTAGGHRPPKRDDRKRFGKTSGKRCYGHHIGCAQTHLDAVALRDRAARRDTLREMAI